MCLVIVVKCGCVKHHLQTVKYPLRMNLDFYTSVLITTTHQLVFVFFLSLVFVVSFGELFLLRPPSMPTNDANKRITKISPAIIHPILCGIKWLLCFCFFASATLFCLLISWLSIFLVDFLLLLSLKVFHCLFLIALKRVCFCFFFLYVFLCILSHSFSNRTTVYLFLYASILVCFLSFRFGFLFCLLSFGCVDNDNNSECDMSKCVG